MSAQSQEKKVQVEAGVDLATTVIKKATCPEIVPNLETKTIEAVVVAEDEHMDVETLNPQDFQETMNQ